MRHIVESQQFDIQLLDDLFLLADEFQIKPHAPLRGFILATLFYEPSTRTRFSFESAMMRLGGQVITSENAREFSSAMKGETLEDSIRVMAHYADAIVLRHHEEGASARAAAVSTVPIINAGDGPGQHPTQALLDLYTIRSELRRIDGVHVVMVGDHRHGRTVRSLAYLLGKYRHVQITFVSPPELTIGDDVADYLRRHQVKVTHTHTLEPALATADVVYQTRIQKERFSDPGTYERLKGCYVLTQKHVDILPDHAIIMHPLPRVDEIHPEVDASPKAVYFKQARYGVYVRMALLTHVLCEQSPLVALSPLHDTMHI